jgi:hypothetical protein
MDSPYRPLGISWRLRAFMMKKVIYPIFSSLLFVSSFCHSQEFNSLESAHKYLNEQENNLTLFGEINSKKAYIMDWSSQGCITQYTQSGEGRSYSGHKLDLRQKVFIDWKQVSTLKDLSYPYRQFLVGGIQYTEYTLLVRGWQAGRTGTAVIFRPSEDLEEKDIKRIFNAMSFIHDTCRNR